MKFQEIQKEIGEYIHSEDDGMARVSLAAIISTRLKLSEPIWLILIGPSSSGKSQILRPLALTDAKFIHRVDDMTENTLLSGIKAKKGEKDISLLKRIGPLGIMVISDFTVIFSKNGESKQAILGQLRMVYDGEMTKFSGNNSEPIVWKGSLGVLAGSTPSIYRHFEEVADMGERFIYYRMKSYDIEKATRRSLSRKIYGKALDDTISEYYKDYIKETITSLIESGEDKGVVPEVSQEVTERVIKVAMFASVIRTPVHYDQYAKAIDRIPVSEMPMRVALQLNSIARGLMVMHHHDTGSWELEEEDIGYLEWCAYSLANEERRACLRVLAKLEYMDSIKTQTVADTIGLSTPVVGMNLQHLSAIGVLNRSGMEGSLTWRIKDKEVLELVRRLEGIETVEKVSEERELTHEDGIEQESLLDKMFGKEEENPQLPVDDSF